MTSPDVLAAGSWHPVRGVVRWQPDDPEAWQRWRNDQWCGTDRGYQRHRSAGETACDDCRRAHAEGVRYYSRRDA